MKQLTQWTLRLPTAIALQLNNLWESDTAFWYVIYGLAGLSTWTTIQMLIALNYFPF